MVLNSADDNIIERKEMNVFIETSAGGTVFFKTHIYLGYSCCVAVVLWQ